MFEWSDVRFLPAVSRTGLKLAAVRGLGVDATMVAPRIHALERALIPFLCLAATCLLAACATTSMPSAAPGENEGISGYVACLDAAARRHDKGHVRNAIPRTGQGARRDYECGGATEIGSAPNGIEHHGRPGFARSALGLAAKSNCAASALIWPPVAISDFVTVQPLLFGRFRASGGFQHVVHRLTEPRCGLRSWRDCALHWPASATRFGVVARFGDDDTRLR
jgi:hypothetical protein